MTSERCEFGMVVIYVITEVSLYTIEVHEYLYCINRCRLSFIFRVAFLNFDFAVIDHPQYVSSKFYITRVSQTIQLRRRACCLRLMLMLQDQKIPVTMKQPILIAHCHFHNRKGTSFSKFQILNLRCYLIIQCGDSECSIVQKKQYNSLT